MATKPAAKAAAKKAAPVKAAAKAVPVKKPAAKSVERVFEGDVKVKKVKPTVTTEAIMTAAHSQVTKIFT